MPTLTLGDFELYYEVDGEGLETVLLIGGVADDIDTWSLQLPALHQAGYRTIRVDNRGVGRSSAPEGHFTTQTLARDLSALLAHLKLGPVHVVGISMGGMIAQELALLPGSDVCSLTLACTYAAPGRYVRRTQEQMIDLTGRAGAAFALQFVMTLAFTPAFFAERDAEAQEYDSAALALAPSTDVFVRQLEASMSHDTSDRLQDIRIPTLVIAAREDVLIPRELSTRLADGIPSAILRVVPGGHCCLWEQPAPFNAAIVEFLGSQ